MIKVEELSYSFPEKDLYTDVSFTIEEGQHAVLIGSNGTGKTTLVDMLLHDEKYMYILTAPGHFSEDELLKIADSIAEIE